MSRQNILKFHAVQQKLKKEKLNYLDKKALVSC